MALGFIFDLVGAGVAAEGERARGKAEQEAAYDEAHQMEAKGKEEFAAAQRDAMAKRKEGNIANSRIQALAAASGGGADDPTVVKLMTGVTSEAEYNAQTDMYGGISRKEGLFTGARNRRKSGDASLLGSQYAATGQLLAGFSRAGSKIATMATGGGFG